MYLNYLYCMNILKKGNNKEYFITKADQHQSFATLRNNKSILRLNSKRKDHTIHLPPLKILVKKRHKQVVKTQFMKKSLGKTKINCRMSGNSLDNSSIPIRSLDESSQVDFSNTCLY